MEIDYNFARDPRTVLVGNQTAFRVVETERPKEGMERLNEIHRQTIRGLHGSSSRDGVWQTADGEYLDNKVNKFKEAVLQDETITREHLVGLIVGSAVYTSYGRAVTSNGGNVNGAGDGGTCR